VRVLLDTHALLWWLAGDLRLPLSARAVADDQSNQMLVSAATAWEITTKYRIGKLPHAGNIAADVLATVVRHGFVPLEISMTHAQLAGSLPGRDRDPFDRMLAAQARIEGIPVLSNDRAFDRYGVKRLW
jgi:PIN domain nuclease of toxin-antitoxin system